MNIRQKLEAEKSRLQKRLHAIDSALAEYNRLEERMAAMLSGDPQDFVPVEKMPSRKAAPSEQTRRGPSPEVAEFEAAVRDILMSATQPIDRVELLGMLESRGVQVGGQDPKNTLSSRMARMDGVSSKRGYGYWLAERVAQLHGLPTDVVKAEVAPNDEDML